MDDTISNNNLGIQSSSKSANNDHNEYKHQEKIMYGLSHGDRRHQIHPNQAPNTIYQCIGRMSMWFGAYHPNGVKKEYVGTGTAFRVVNDEVYVITCAHNVRDKKLKSWAKSIKFERQCPNNGWQSYEAHITQVHSDYGKAHTDDKESNDLAILKFKDTDGFYRQLLTQTVIDIAVDEQKSQHTYSIYGYPGIDPNENHSNVQIWGELWGMSAIPYNWEYDPLYSQYIPLYIRKNKSKTMYFYNAIDTEGGQSGSAIFLPSGNGSFCIVGIHTGGSKHEHRNWGVALNKDQIDWINSWTMPYTNPIIDNHPIYSQELRSLREMSLIRNEATLELAILCLQQTNGWMDGTVEILSS